MKVTLVGLGPHGRRFLKPLQAMSNLELAAVVDQRKEALGHADIPADVSRFTDAVEAFGKIPPQVVIIATNAPSHTSIAISAMKAGATHVLVEKPMAPSLRECDAILEAAAKHNVRLSVDHIRRLSSSQRWLCERLASGVWGQLRSIHIQKAGIGLGCVATHSFDTAYDLVGRKAKAVTAWVDAPHRTNPRGTEFTDPGGLVVLDFGQETRAVILQNEDASGPESLEMNLQFARVRLEDKFDRLEVLTKDPQAIRAPNKPLLYEAVAVPAEAQRKADPQSLVGKVLEDLVGTGELVCRADHGRDAMEVLAAAYLSHQRGHQPVELPLTKPEEMDLWLPVT